LDGVLKELIESHLVRKNISRAQLSETLGYAKGHIDKVLSGAISTSPKFLKALELRAGILLPKPVELDLYLPPLNHIEVGHLYGLWQTVRPSFRDKKSLNAFLTEIVWSEDYKSLSFREIGNVFSPDNKGVVSVPRQSTNIYFLAHTEGRFRLAIMADDHSKTRLLGGLFTVSSEKMSNRNPTATPVVMMKISSKEDAVFGLIDRKHKSFKEWLASLHFCQTEDYFKMLGGA
jgi:hypothetical protein